MHEQARTDALTGLINRAELYRQLRREPLAPPRAFGDAAGSDHRWDLGVLYCDLDHFKHVNDRYGHATGDRLLVDVAAVLRGEHPRRTT
ncbi:MAG: diguanylate cyclase [Microthrixaceae bacterium]